MVENKKILFITDSCPPNLTMNGVVMKNIIDVLSGKNDIGIIAVKQSAEDVEFFQGVKVRYVKSLPYYILGCREKRIHSYRKATRCFYGAATLVFRILSVLARVISPIGVNVFMTIGIRKQVQEVLNQRNFDFVLCNARPFEGFEAVFPLISQYQKTRFLAYQTDDFITAQDERYLPNVILKKRNRKRRKRINEYIDRFHNYCMLESVYQKESRYIQHKGRVKPVGVPLLLDTTERIEKKIPTGAAEKVTGTEYADVHPVIRLVFAGSLVKSFRPPDDCLNIILEVAKKHKIHFDIYHRGDCSGVVDYYAKRSGGAVQNHGSVSTETAYQAMEEADILVSISNYSGDQISGKTFDYMSTGKPIVHFYYNKSDLNAAVLNKYRLAINIRIGKGTAEEQAAKILNFIESTKGKQVVYSQIKQAYRAYTSEAVSAALFHTGPLKSLFDIFYCENI